MKGFTLVEVLLSISLVSIVAAFSVPVFQSLLYRSETENAATQIVTVLRSAQTQSRNQNNDSNWGVYLSGSSATLYSGINYASRNVLEDQVFSFERVSLAGLTEINFQKINGTPNISGTININGEANSLNISINSKGTIDY